VNVKSLTVQTYANNTSIAQDCQYTSIRTKFIDGSAPHPPMKT